MATLGWVLQLFLECRAAAVLKCWFMPQLAELSFYGDTDERSKAVCAAVLRTPTQRSTVFRCGAGLLILIYKNSFGDHEHGFHIALGLTSSRLPVIAVTVVLQNLKRLQ